MSQLIGTVTHYEARFIHGWMPFPSEWWAVMDEEGMYPKGCNEHYGDVAQHG